MGRDRRLLLLRYVQPSLLGFSDGAISSVSPVLASLLITRSTSDALLIGVAVSVGAAISMALSEFLSDTGERTERGSAYLRGAITGAGTFLGSIIHCLPLLLPYAYALAGFFSVVVLELALIALMRSHFYGVGISRSSLEVSLAFVIIVAASYLLGHG